MLTDLNRTLMTYTLTVVSGILPLNAGSLPLESAADCPLLLIWEMKVIHGDQAFSKCRPAFQAQTVEELRSCLQYLMHHG